MRREMMLYNIYIYTYILISIHININIFILIYIISFFCFSKYAFAFGGIPILTRTTARVVPTECEAWRSRVAERRGRCGLSRTPAPTMYDVMWFIRCGTPSAVRVPNRLTSCRPGDTSAGGRSTDRTDR